MHSGPCAGPRCPVVRLHHTTDPPPRYVARFSALSPETRPPHQPALPPPHMALLRALRPGRMSTFHTCIRRNSGPALVRRPETRLPLDLTLPPATWSATPLWDRGHACTTSVARLSALSRLPLDAVGAMRRTGGTLAPHTRTATVIRGPPLGSEPTASGCIRGHAQDRAARWYACTTQPIRHHDTWPASRL